MIIVFIQLHFLTERLLFEEALVAGLSFLSGALSLLGALSAVLVTLGTAAFLTGTSFFSTVLAVEPVELNLRTLRFSRDFMS